MADFVGTRGAGVPDPGGLQRALRDGRSEQLRDGSALAAAPSTADSSLPAQVAPPQAASPGGAAANYPIDSEDARPEGTEREERAAAMAPDQELTRQEEREIRALRQRELQVRRHERAHLAAAGDLAVKPPTYGYEVGPDGARYVVEGEVKLRTPESSLPPEERLEQALKIREAALAPTDPSPEDLQVASQARQLEAEARRELLEDRSRAATGGEEERPQA